MPNFHVVNDHVCRGGQPTADGFRELRDRYGVATVVNLDGRTAADERAIVGDLGMRYVSVPLRARDLDMARLRDALAAMRSSAGPVYVHCHAGMDRTGAAVAGYRVAYDGWTVDRALREMRACREPWHGLLYPNVSDAVRGVGG